MKPRIIEVYKTEGGDVSVARRRNIPVGKWINVTPLEDVIQMIEGIEKIFSRWRKQLNRHNKEGILDDVSYSKQRNLIQTIEREIKIKYFKPLKEVEL